MWLRATTSRRRLEREMREEMTAHLAQATERFKARGMSDDQARIAARAAVVLELPDLGFGR